MRYLRLKTYITYDESWNSLIHNAQNLKAAKQWASSKHIFKQLFIIVTFIFLCRYIEPTTQFKFVGIKFEKKIFFPIGARLLNIAF